MAAIGLLPMLMLAVWWIIEIKARVKRIEKALGIPEELPKK